MINSVYVNVRNEGAVENNAPVDGFNSVCTIDRLVALAAVETVQIGVFQLCCVQKILEAACGRTTRQHGPTEGTYAHWASNSSSETSSGGMVRVLLARILLMLVKERRLAIPIRLTPVPSRFT